MSARIPDRPEAPAALDRREFLKAGALAGGGLVIGISLAGCSKPAELAKTAALVRGMLAAVKIAEIHKSMVLKKFEKYIVSYVLAGSLVQGTRIRSWCSLW